MYCSTGGGNSDEIDLPFERPIELYSVANDTISAPFDL